ncbi:MAG: urea transporter [Bacteroidia bacterium]
MFKTIKEYLGISLTGLLNSYAQIFFSLNKYLGLFLLLITCIDFSSGLSGLVAIVIVQLMAFFFNFNRELIRDGTYTYNALLSGIALGSFYHFSTSFFVLLVASSLLSFLLTLWFLNSLGKKALPILTIPFLLTVWIILLGAGNFTALTAKYNEISLLQTWWPSVFSVVTDSIAFFPFSNVIYLYLRSLGAILFQYNDLSGLIIATGLLLNSRIAFVLSVFGFVVGYGFYQFMEGDFSQLIYTYIGFNFILTAIALGGFFVVPSRRSFINLLFTIPVIALLISSLHSFLFIRFGLPLYSLPFNIVVLLFIAAMQNRIKASGLNLVSVQQYSPEKHHYNFFSNSERFQKDTWVHVVLPVIGEWYISQGYDGNITHRSEWKHAWDFDVRDEMGKTFHDSGTKKEDFYCFNLPVLAPADGVIVDMDDDVEDNEVGKVNLKKNWGNALVIKHSEYLFSKLTHFKKNSLKVKVGDFVHKGAILAMCGSSGRSPEPHLHFQFQATPYIGSETLNYPFSFYITKEGHHHKFHSFDVPQLGERVSNLRTTPLLIGFFSFIPGMKFSVSSTENEIETWEVMASPYNHTYIWCKETNSILWFVNNGIVFYCSSFEGDRTSLLYDFFLAAYKVPQGYYANLTLDDHISILNVSSYLLRFIHDFTAPFFHYVRAKYNFKYAGIDNDHAPMEIVYLAEHSLSIFGSIRSIIHYTCMIKDKSFKIDVEKGNRKKTILCELSS